MLPLKVWLLRAREEISVGECSHADVWRFHLLFKCKSEASRCIQENTDYYSLILHTFRYSGAAISSSALSHSLLLLFLVRCLMEKDKARWEEGEECRGRSLAVCCPSASAQRRRPYRARHLLTSLSGARWFHATLSLRNLMLRLQNILQFRMFDTRESGIMRNPVLTFWHTMPFPYILFMSEAGSSIAL